MQSVAAFWKKNIWDTWKKYDTPKLWFLMMIWFLKNLTNAFLAFCWGKWPSSPTLIGPGHVKKQLHMTSLPETTQVTFSINQLGHGPFYFTGSRIIAEKFWSEMKGELIVTHSSMLKETNLKALHLVFPQCSPFLFLCLYWHWSGHETAFRSGMRTYSLFRVLVFIDILVNVFNSPHFAVSFIDLFELCIHAVPFYTQFICTMYAIFKYNIL